jgi:hypothetical protein
VYRRERELSSLRETVCLVSLFILRGDYMRFVVEGIGNGLTRWHMCNSGLLVYLCAKIV